MKTWKQSTFIGIMAILVLAFALVACDDGNNDGNGNGNGTEHSLDGIWVSSSGMVITVSGNNGVLSALGSSTSALSQDALNKGYVTVGGQIWRNLTQNTGTLTWSGQDLGPTYNTNSPNVAIGASWANSTFTLSADGQTLTRTGTGSATYTRGNYSLDGIWVNSSGMTITVNGNNGVLTALGSSVSALSQSAIDQGFITVDGQIWRNLTQNASTLTWSGQDLGPTYNTNSPNVAIGASWANSTFTLSAGGQTLTKTGTETSATYTRKQ